MDSNSGDRLPASAGTASTGAESGLIERAKAGDSQAFAALVRPHMRMLHAVCYRIVGDEAEDAVQNALIAAWRYIDRFEGRARFSTWLFQIAHNAALAAAKKHVPLPAGDAAELHAGTRPGPEGGVVARLALQDALARIPPDFRAAVVLREFAGLSYNEIAEAEGIRVETVKTRIARGRQALARLLGEP